MDDPVLLVNVSVPLVSKAAVILKTNLTLQNAPRNTGSSNSSLATSRRGEYDSPMVGVSRDEMTGHPWIPQTRQPRKDLQLPESILIGISILHIAAAV